jgi:hypothetical protein
MTNAARTLDGFPLVRTRNAEEMCDALGRVYAKPTLVPDRHTKKVDVVVNRYQAQNLAIAYTKHGTDITAVYPENTFTLQAFPVRGRGVMTINRIAHPLGPRRGMIVSSDVSYAMKLNADYEHFVLVMDTQVLASKLTALTGTALERPLHFRALPDNQCPAAKALHDHFFFLVDRLSASTAPLPKLVIAEFEETIIVMFLHANRHSYSHLLEREALDCALRQVRRAEDYIEANASRAITLEELGEVTGVSVLSLSSAFKKHRGYSPLEFLSQVRSKHEQAPN